MEYILDLINEQPEDIQISLYIELKTKFKKNISDFKEYKHQWYEKNKNKEYFCK